MPNEFLIRRTHEYRRPVPPPIVPIFTEEEIAAWDEEMRISRERFDENMARLKANSNARRSDPWPTYNWDDPGVGGFDLNSFISGASRGNVTYEDILPLFMRYRGK